MLIRLIFKTLLSIDDQKLVAFHSLQQFFVLLCFFQRLWWGIDCSFLSRFCRKKKRFVAEKVRKYFDGVSGKHKIYETLKNFNELQQLRVKNCFINKHTSNSMLFYSNLNYLNRITRRKSSSIKISKKYSKSHQTTLINFMFFNLQFFLCRIKQLKRLSTCPTVSFSKTFERD